MKKTLLFIGAFLVGILCQAQTYDSIAHHKVGWFDCDMREDMMQLRDGSILVHVELFEVDEQGSYISDYGNRFYKISRNGAVIMDSTFLEDNDLNWFLLKQNPLDDDNVFAKLVRNLDSCRTDLCIRFFDDNLEFNPAKEIWVPVSDTLFPPLKDAYMTVNGGELIFHCPFGDHVLFMQVGFDGTVKTRSEIPFPTFPELSYISGPRMGSFQMSTAKYGFWGYSNSPKKLTIVTLDSLLNRVEELVPYDAPEGLRFDFGMKDRVLDWDDETFLVASEYAPIGNDQINGVRVTRYRKATLEAINTCYFETKPFISFSGITVGCAAPFGLAMSNDGNIYFAYSTYSMIGMPYGQISLVKMDPDFNIIWQRFCLEPEGYSRVGSDIAVLDDGGVAVGGMVYGTPPEFFVIVFNDDNWGLSESMAQIRPYTYFPNPAQSVLHLQFSPDVQPALVELYDLQGRLVRTQGQTFEHIDISQLPAGIYTMRVTLQDGQVFSDKVVKE